MHEYDVDLFIISPGEKSVNKVIHSDYIQHILLDYWQYTVKYILMQLLIKVTGKVTHSVTVQIAVNVYISSSKIIPLITASQKMCQVFRKICSDILEVFVGPYTGFITTLLSTLSYEHILTKKQARVWWHLFDLYRRLTFLATPTSFVNCNCNIAYSSKTGLNSRTNQAVILAYNKAYSSQAHS